MLPLSKEGPLLYQLPRRKHSGKRVVPAMISTAPSGRDGTGLTRRRIVIAVEVRDSQGKTRVEKALIDSGAEENCVRQSLAIDCGWNLTSKETIGLATLDRRQVWTYGLHNINITATDSGDHTESSRHDFIACDFGGIDTAIILGYL